MLQNKVFTYQEVYDMLANMHADYDLSSTDKFIARYLSNYQDAPPDAAIERATQRDIEMYIN